jgi:hypothetical protein
VIRRQAQSAREDAKIQATLETAKIERRYQRRNVKAEIEMAVRRLATFP